ncbi:hypothetical protein AVDCRST_MAG94-2258 [uncultured Leptolyngbya sp.]|uniref:Uncharacterized protein n=1 Tax=uncultured Leptolyngbya sp. TaxID=332963 RepID=A0A6J4LQX6_9CYAN|nr:hypothetical protein AVDCRST_MAG94-2258 [uncultured Leptolyngbya sp.]
MLSLVPLLHPQLAKTQGASAGSTLPENVLSQRDHNSQLTFNVALA